MNRRKYLLWLIPSMTALRSITLNADTHSKWDSITSMQDLMWVDLQTDGSVDAAQGEVSTQDVYEAFELIWDMPKLEIPYNVAEQIVSINKVNSRGESYLQEWEIQFNPLIVFFFVVAKHLPEGDITPWCAAFVNFCLEKSGLNGTRSAGSKTFRTYGQKTENPKQGDIVVFEEKSRPNRGHVGFYVDEGADAILVLGGNQSNKVDKSWYLKDGDRLKLHSYRRIE